MNQRNPECGNNFTQCYLKYFDCIKIYINRIIEDIHISEELAQDVFLIFFKKTDNFNPSSGRVRNFIYKIARNRSLDYIKRRKKENEKYSQIAIEDVIMDRQFYKDIEDTYIEGEILCTFYDAVNSFPPTKREIYFDRHYKKKQLVTIMKEYKVSKYLLKKIDHDLSMKIRDSLAQYFADECEDEENQL